MNTLLAEATTKTQFKKNCKLIEFRAPISGRRPTLWTKLNKMSINGGHCCSAVIGDRAPLIDFPFRAIIIRTLLNRGPPCVRAANFATPTTFSMGGLIFQLSTAQHPSTVHYHASISVDGSNFGGSFFYAAMCECR